MLNKWIISFSKNPSARVRLFCFHYSGTGPSAFKDWHKHLPEFVEVRCIQLPGREYRFKEPLITEVDEVIRQLSEFIVCDLDMPCVFFGHSLGALIAHRLLAGLNSEKQALVNCLIVSGCAAPSDSNEYYEKISHLPDKEFLAKLPEYGGTPESILANDELMEIFTPILRADFTMSENAEGEVPALKCPIAVFGGIDDRASEENLSMWERETTGACHVEMFPGGHFFINECQESVLGSVASIVQHSARQPRVGYGPTVMRMS